MTRTPRSLALLAAGVAAVTVAGPALAETEASPVLVTFAAAGPDRDFYVEELDGSPLTRLDLGQGGQQPFRTRVQDKDVTGSYGRFDVEAEMTNFYLKTSPASVTDPAQFTYDYSTMIPSGDVSLVFPTQPLSASGVSFSVLPKVDVKAALDCTDSGVQGILGITLTGLLNNLLSPVDDAVCDALALAAPASAPVGVVDGVVQAVTSGLTGLTDLPTKITGASGGTTMSFDGPSFAPGSVAAGQTPPSGNVTTKVPIMAGQPTDSAALLQLVNDQLDAAFSATTPLASADGTGALTSVTNVVQGLQSSTDPVLKGLGDAISGLTDATERLNLVNTLTGTVRAVTNVDLTGINGQYLGVPTLRAVPSSVPTPGDYAGTLTVTFIQQ